MNYATLVNVGRLLFSGDAASLVPYLKLSLGLRGLIPRPAILVSCIAAKKTVHISDSKPSKLARILFFSHNLRREGASISLKELVCGLRDRQSISPMVVAFEDGPLRIDYEACGIPVQVVPSFLYKVSTPKRLNRQVEQIARLIRSTNSDAVFVNTLWNFPAVLAAEQAGLPSIWNPRESEPWDRYFNFLPNQIAQTAVSAIGLPRKVVFVAEATRAVWRDFEGSNRFTVIHNSLNQKRFIRFLSGDKRAERIVHGWAEDEVVFICVGTVIERKGQIDALLALEDIAEKLNSPIRLIFIGDTLSSYASRLRHHAQRIDANIKININFVPPTASVGSYYLAADVFMLCSRVESYPRVILEAMAFGLPIITTPVFGVAEQLPDPSDACFYEPGSHEVLGNHMLQLTNGTDMRKKFSEKSRSCFESMHSFEEMLFKYEQILQHVTQSTSPPDQIV